MTASYLADACALIVFFLDDRPTRVMPNAAVLMQQMEVLVSAITIWEITRKVAVGKLPASWGGQSSLSQLLRVQGFVPYPLSWEDAEAANQLPPLHRDPMDRMLIASALRSGLTIITNDAQFPAYGVKTIW